jgi:hypothetical protein
MAIKRAKNTYQDCVSHSIQDVEIYDELTMKNWRNSMMGITMLQILAAVIWTRSDVLPSTHVYAVRNNIV